MLYDPATDTLHVLNPVAAAVWDGLGSARDAEELLAHCRLALGDGDRTELVRELRETVTELDRAGLLEPTGLPDDPVAAGGVLLARRCFTEAAAVLGTPEVLGGTTGRRAHVLLAIAQAAAGDLADASATLLAALARWPDDSVLLGNLGGIHLVAGNLAEAANAFERALELDAGQPDAWSNLGVARVRQGDSEGAAVCWQRALLLDPLHPAALGQLAALHVAAGRRAEGMLLLQRAADQPRIPALLTVAVGRLYVQLGELTNAEDVLRRAVVSTPDSAAVRNALGVVLARRDRPAEARQCFEAALARDPVSLAARFNLLQLHARAGRWAELTAQAEALLPHVSDSPSIRLSTARAYLAQERADAAERVLRDGLTQQGCRLPCAEALVKLLLERRRPLDAFLVYLEVAPELRDVDPAPFPTLARLRLAPPVRRPQDGSPRAGR
jgi:Tfp pilus assembly protein PilF